MGLSLTEAKEFIEFCILNKIQQVTYSDLSFIRVPEFVQDNKREPTTEELLYGSEGLNRLATDLNLGL